VSVRKVVGFTLIELMVVIAVIGILSVVALPRMMDTHDNAHEAVVKGAGGALASAVVMARSQWIANGSSVEVDGVTGFGIDNVATSADGWPTDAGQGGGSNHSNIMSSADRCVRLWGALLVANAPKVGSSASATVDYVATTTSGNCRFTYQNTDASNSIIYDARIGEVITNI